MNADHSTDHTPDRTELGESRRVTLAACALLGASQTAFAAIDYSLFGLDASALDLAHALTAAIAGLWLWRRGGSERAYEAVFVGLALLFFPVVAVSEIRGAELGMPRDPLVPLQFVMLAIAALAPGRDWIGVVTLAIFTAGTIVFWSWLEARHPLPGAIGEPYMAVVYAGVAGTVLWLRIRRRRLMRQLATARAEADALARIARLFVGVRDQTNTPLQSIEIATALLAKRAPQGDPLVARMRNATLRLRELTSLLSAAEAWPHEDVGADVDLAREVAEAAAALDRAFAVPPRNA